MLIKPIGPPDDGTSSPQCQQCQETRSFMEVLFTSLLSDIQVVKKGLSADLREVQQSFEEIGDRFSAVEDCKAEHKREVE
ncbi:hypothetical protein NDU88_005243 [Pleurodeles waltl]|uniref:Uncharacterized protein n=1 Tax=Pleurodeles waltl TaxID=8319 RepID=A0AAV7UHH5_PLEWA|nr:hypothetical protein NDU88_005243 [Pleurodeles waltl]